MKSNLKVKKSLYVPLTLFVVMIILVILNINSVQSDYTPLVVLSESMEEAIAPGDIIVIRKKDKYYINDIITYQMLDYNITHRIVDIDNNKYYITKGDNNSSVDSHKVRYEQIKGEVIYIIPKVGYIIISVKKTYILVLFIFLMSVLVFINKKNLNMHNTFI